MNTRKRRYYGEPARTGYGTILDVKVAHRKAKRRSIVKDKKREIHRQNERHRHHSVNLAIQELSQLVPCLEPRRNNTKQNIVQRTGEYMEYLNNKVTAMCDQLRCTKSLCHDSLAMSQILSAVVDGQEEKFPADNPIHLSNLEALLDNMHIENRTYKIRKQAERDDCLNSEEEGLGDQKEVKKSFRVQSIKGARKKSDSDFPRGQPFVASPSFHESRSFTSPSVSGSTSLCSQEVVTPGYLGDGEESASPVGTASCTKSLSLSNSSDDISDDGSMDDAAISSAVKIVVPRGNLMNPQKYPSSTKRETSKKLLLLTDKSVSKEIQQQRVIIYAEQFASIRKCQVADGRSPRSRQHDYDSRLPTTLVIPNNNTKLLQIVPAQSSAQNIKVTTESLEKGTRGSRGVLVVKKIDQNQ
ncbi:hypothetical protein BSL78_01586 [Apostichopus japonicus]|uniref:BHLH domain-containing protein n=1 Tax=Stichopus japonicus TaxID=307972 RepID=A0A2G8LMH7_STIJA|nr:hypothetical protein BSL78_01586 [Apostichopus japonicus]